MRGGVFPPSPCDGPTQKELERQTKSSHFAASFWIFNQAEIHFADLMAHKECFGAAIHAIGSMSLTQIVFRAASIW